MTTTAARTLAERLDLPALTAELARYATDVDLHRRAPVEGVRALGRHGLMGALIPQQYGGIALTAAELFEAGAAVAEGCGATGLIWGQHLAATAFIARFGNTHTRSLLPAAATGARHFGIGVGYTSRPGGPVQAVHRGGRTLISGTATWVTGSALMTDALLSAEDQVNGGRTIMGVVPRSALTVQPPYQMVAVTSGLNADVSFSDVDITDTLLDLPPERTAISSVFTANKAPRDAGFHVGLTRLALATIRHGRPLDPDLLPALDRVETAAAVARAAMVGWLTGKTYEDIDVPQFWQHYQAIATIMWDAAGLVMSAGGSGGLRDGALPQRIAREAMYYLARINVKGRLPVVEEQAQRALSTSRL